MPLAKPISPVLQREHTLAKGLVLAWPLFENSGKSAYDLSGNGYTGTFTGNWTGGPSGAAAHTDGSTTDISRFSSSAAPPVPNVQTGDFTVALRFTVSTLGGYTPVFDFYDAQSGRMLSLFLNA